MDNEPAKTEFIRNIQRARELIRKIDEDLYNHHGIDPDSVQWGHAEHILYVANRLEQIAESLGLE